MKKARIIHRIAAFITLACMLAFMLPAAAFAANPVDNVELEVVSDIAGLTPQNYSQIVKIINSEVTYADSDPDDPRVIIAQTWNGVAVSEDEPFVAGKSYTLRIYLAAGEDMAITSEKPIVVINGTEVDASDIQMVSGGEYPYMIVGYPITVRERQVVKSLDIDVNEDIAGLTPADYKEIITIHSDNMTYDDVDPQDPTVIYASKQGSSYWMEQSDPFEGGEAYKFEMYFVPKAGWSLVDESEVKINGVKVPIENVELRSINGVNRLLVKCNVSVSDASEPMNEAEKLELSIEKNIIGKTAADYDDFVSVDSEGLILDKSLPLPVEAHETTKPGGSVKSAVFNGKFQAGKEYLLRLYLVQDEGWKLPESVVPISINGEVGAEDAAELKKITGVTRLVVDVRVQPTDKEDITVELTINNKNYSVNGVKKTADTAPIILNSRTFVPFRLTAEALGAKVEWDGDKRTVTTVYNGHTIVMTIDQKTYTIDGKAKTMDVAPFINSDNRTMVPLRFVTEGIGCTVTPHYASDGTTASVTVTN